MVPVVRSPKPSTGTSHVMFPRKINSGLGERIRNGRHLTSGSWPKTPARHLPLRKRSWMVVTVPLRCLDFSKSKLRDRTTVTVPNLSMIFVLGSNDPLFRFFVWMSPFVSGTSRKRDLAIEPFNTRHAQDDEERRRLLWLVVFSDTVSFNKTKRVVYGERCARHLWKRMCDQLHFWSDLAPDRRQ